MTSIGIRFVFAQFSLLTVSGVVSFAITRPFLRMFAEALFTFIPNSSRDSKLSAVNFLVESSIISKWEVPGSFTKSLLSGFLINVSFFFDLASSRFFLAIELIGSTFNTFLKIFSAFLNSRVCRKALPSLMLAFLSSGLSFKSSRLGLTAAFHFCFNAALMAFFSSRAALFLMSFSMSTTVSNLSFMSSEKA